MQNHCRRYELNGKMRRGAQGAIRVRDVARGMDVNRLNRSER
jgi:hypothetical protein